VVVVMVVAVGQSRMARGKKRIIVTL